MRKSPYWKRCFGCDHMFASSHTDSPTTRIMSRMKPLSDSLICSTAGRYKARAGGGCQTEIPYGANPYAIRQYELQKDRPILASFSGTLDVCCSGQNIRCSLGNTFVASHADTDVSLFITTRNNALQNDTCAARTLNKLEQKTNASYIVQLRKLWEQSFVSVFHTSEAQMALSRHAGETMADSVFCLIPCVCIRTPPPPCE